MKSYSRDCRLNKLFKLRFSESFGTPMQALKSKICIKLANLIKF